MNILQRAFSPIAKAVNRQIGIRGAEPRKGNFQWMAGLPSKKVLKPIVVNALTLKALSNTDPITWAIKKTRKNQITGVDWDIVRDTEQIELELDRWYNVIMNNINPWGFEEVFHPISINRDLYLKASNDIKNILNTSVATPINPLKAKLTGVPQGTSINKDDMKKQIKWYFESIKRKVKQDADEHAQIVKRIFERPNDSETRTFRSFLEVLLDDLLTFDAGVIVKNYNILGELAEMYLIPGQDVKLYRNPDRTIPQPPEPAYVWEDQGTLRAEYTKKEIIYLMDNPQQNGYGMSPLEVAAYIITASLYADEYNMDFFKHSNVPPAIFNLGKNITQEQRKQFETLWDNEVAGKGLHRMMFLSGAEDPSYIPMRNLSSRDMQMMEYLKWTLSIKCACYQVTPQDIGFVADYHRSTSQTQKELTKDKGVKNLLALLKSYFNTEIVKKEFPFKDVKFDWMGVDLQDEKAQSEIDIQDINAGVISRNDRRKRLGMPAVEGGDTILVNMGTGNMVPIEELVPPEETPEETQPLEVAAQAKEVTTGQPTNLKDKKDEAVDETVDRTTKPDVNKPVVPKSGEDKTKPLTDGDKGKLVRMIVNYSHQDKISKAMDALKEQGLGENEVKITLEE